MDQERVKKLVRELIIEIGEDPKMVLLFRKLVVL